MAEPDEVQAMERRYREGGMGYGDAKKALDEVVERMVGPARARRERLASDAAYVEDVLSASARRAREVARELMAEVREVCGLVTGKDTHH